MLKGVVGRLPHLTPCLWIEAAGRVRRVTGEPESGSCLRPDHSYKIALMFCHVNPFEA